jgi:hypothetical protein
LQLVWTFRYVSNLPLAANAFGWEVLNEPQGGIDSYKHKEKFDAFKVQIRPRHEEDVGVASSFN